MFLGSWKPSFNLKSRRIALPKKIRDYLATSEVVLSYGFETCIFGFDVKAWEKESKKQFDFSLSLKAPRDIRRFLFSTARFVKLDNQGRFVIPFNLFKYAKIKQPIVIGAGDHFEIWEEKLWGKYLEGLERTKQ